MTPPSSVTSIGYGAFGGCARLVYSIFTGNAPTLERSVSNDTGPGFTVYYLAGSTGFTSPTWEGYPTVKIDQSAHPAANWLLTHSLPYDTDLHQDFNGGGVTLLTAYALNFDPSNPSAGMPVPGLGSGTLSMTYYGMA